MARVLLASCLCALAGYAAASGVGGSGPLGNRKTTYTQIEGFKGQWDITVEATKDSDKSVFVKQVCNSTDIKAPCNQPLLTADAHDQIRVTAAPAAAAAPLKTLDGLEPEHVIMRLCFTKPYTVDRAWRKPGDVIDQDKACPTEISNQPIAADGTYSATWSVPKGAPKATWYVKVLVECKNGTSTAFCQYDSTMNKTYFGTDIIDSTPVTMKVAVAICSAIAPVFLIVFFIKEQVLKKRA